MTEEKKKLHLGLWVAQGLLAVAFGLSGAMKTFAPIAMIAENLPWVLEYPETLLRFIGISEVLGALGMILPSASKLMPKLTGFAGIGLVIVMVLALGFHLMRAEYAAIVPNLILGGMAGFVAWGRLKAVPIEK